MDLSLEKRKMKRCWSKEKKRMRKRILVIDGWMIQVVDGRLVDGQYVNESWMDNLWIDMQRKCKHIHM